MQIRPCWAAAKPLQWKLLPSN